MIDVVLLGTAAAMPSPQRALACATAHLGGRGILFDCGEGTQVAARRAGVSLMKVDVIALTHYHGDHIFGLPGLLQTLGCQGRQDPLCITGPEGLDDVVKLLLRLTGSLPFRVTMMTLPPQGAALCVLFPGWPAGAFLSPVPTKHRSVSQGYRLTLSRPGRFDPNRASALGVPQPLWRLIQRGEPVTVEGRTVFPDQVMGAPRRGVSLVYTGDTAPCDAVARAAQDTDLLIHEATYGGDDQADSAQRYGHSTFCGAAALAGKAHARRLWLTHFSQAMENPETFLPAARALFPDTVCGWDGMRITLRYEQT